MTGRYVWWRPRWATIAAVVVGFPLAVAAMWLGLEGWRGTRCQITDGPVGRVRLVRLAAAEFLQRQGRCPFGADELVTDGYLRTARQLVDVWGGAIVVRCRTGYQGELAVLVMSAGPDGVYDSHDDVVLPAG
jgi:hypothetical protein